MLMSQCGFAALLILSREADDAVPREVRSSKVVRRVYDFWAEAIATELAP